jgi:hypothetical protein
MLSKQNWEKLAVTAAYFKRLSQQNWGKVAVIAVYFKRISHI